MTTLLQLGVFLKLFLLLSVLFSLQSCLPVFNGMLITVSTFTSFNKHLKFQNTLVHVGGLVHMVPVFRKDTCLLEIDAFVIKSL